MVKVSRTLRRVIRKTRWPWKKLKIYFKSRLGWMGMPVILPYTGYSNGKELVVSGSVIEDRGLAKPRSKQRLRTNILTMFKRYVGDTFAGVPIRIQYNDQQFFTETDENGYFHSHFTVEKPIRKEVFWDTAVFSFDEAFDIPRQMERTQGSILVVSKNPSHMIVSDVDDTIMVSYSTQMAKKVWLMLSKNAYTRIPFPGVAAFYNALQKGLSGKELNPIFYVSSSEWNLYDLLFDFCKFRQIPKGPFLLREMQTNLFRMILAGGGNHMHKLNKIKFLLAFFQDLPLILIGDSGQRDPEIYLHILRAFPDRIKAIYIRQVKKSRTLKSLDAIKEESSALGTPMIFVKSTEEAAQHAVRNNLILEEEFQTVRRQKHKEAGAN